MSAAVINYSPQLPAIDNLLSTPVKSEAPLSPWESNGFGLLSSPTFESANWSTLSPDGRRMSLPYSLQRAINTRNLSNSSDEQYTPRNLSQLKAFTSPTQPQLPPTPITSPSLYSNDSLASSPSSLSRSSVSSEDSLPFVHAVASIGYKFPLDQPIAPITLNAEEPSWEEGDTSKSLRTPLAKSVELSAPREVVEEIKKVDHLADYRLDRADGPCKPFITKLAHLCWRPELYEDVIKWDSTGTCFLVAPSERFLTKVLPDIFSHGSFTAFTRQLKTYGFRHLTAQQVEASFKYSPDTTTPIKDLSAWTHPYFRKANPGNLNRLVPKPSKARKLHQEEKMAAVNRMGR